MNEELRKSLKGVEAIAKGAPLGNRNAAKDYEGKGNLTAIKLKNSIAKETGLKPFKRSGIFTSGDFSIRENNQGGYDIHVHWGDTHNKEEHKGIVQKVKEGAERLGLETKIIPATFGTFVSVKRK